MNANFELERRLADFYASEAPRRAPERVLEGVLASSDRTAQRHAVIRVPWRFRRMTTAAKLAVAAILLIAAGAIGFALAGNRPPLPVLVPWTPDRLDQDWPAPVRAEPVGGGPIVKMGLADDATWDSSRGIWDSFVFSDPVGDVAGEGVAWVDISEVGLGPGTVTAIALELADDVPRPQAHPADRWIAYGIVQDTNGDGVADVRIGIDNLPVSEHRAWRTDLASGETKSAVGPPYGWVGTAQGGGGAGRVGLDSYYPGEGEQSGNRASIRYSVTFEELTRRRADPFYAWASLIEDGRVVATDYAPDTGWLQEGAQPEPEIRLDGPAWASESELSGDGEVSNLVQRLTITADGKITFNTGCTKGEGNVTVEPDRLRVSDLVLTEVICRAEYAELDAKAMAVLGAGEINYDLTGEILQLWAGEHVIQFAADFEDPPS